jgi:hypothetical protein
VIEKHYSNVNISVFLDFIKLLKMSENKHQPTSISTISQASMISTSLMLDMRIVPSSTLTEDDVDFSPVNYECYIHCAIRIYCVVRTYCVEIHIKEQGGLCALRVLCMRAYLSIQLCRNVVNAFSWSKMLQKSQSKH